MHAVFIEDAIEIKCIAGYLYSNWFTIANNNNEVMIYVIIVDLL